MNTQKTGLGALLTAGTAAILASTCCLGPLLLVMLGFSGAWIGKLRVFEPYSHYFIAASVIAMFFAFKRIFRPAEECKPGEVCALPHVNRGYKLMFGLVLVLILTAISYPFIAPYFY